MRGARSWAQIYSWRQFLLLGDVVGATRQFREILP
jgi:hypothetical protein